MIKFITPTQLKTKIEANEVLLIDIREQYEKDICQLKHSVSIPMDAIETIIEQVKSSTKTPVIICKSGKRAEPTANFIDKSIDIELIYVLEGGISAWIEQIDNQLENY
ncbi:MAG: rhodanese-like domain-containing protein [Crocinitomicaceae bacterium]